MDEGRRDKGMRRVDEAGRDKGMRRVDEGEGIRE